VFTMRVGNLLAGERVTVRLVMTGPLPWDEGEATFRFPLVVAPRYIPGAPLEGEPVGSGTEPDTDAVPDASRITPPVLLPGFPNPVVLSIRVRIDPAGLDLDFRLLMKTLLSLKVRNYEEACWGYNFPWQSRAFYAPVGMPNVVCTTLAANAYLDWYEASRDERVLEVAASSGRFLLERINKTVDGDSFCFSYTPGDQTCVHNVNLMAAELLSRLYTITRSEEFREAAVSAAKFSINRQRPDGSWPYGEADNQGWIDSIHTAFILISLKRIIGFLDEPGWRENLQAGYRFYANNFLLADGRPKYYHNKLFPVDAHSAAAAIIALVELSDSVPGSLEMAENVIGWALANLQDPTGYFYYQRRRFYTIKIPYFRWAQAWMLYALACYTVGVRVKLNG